MRILLSLFILIELSACASVSSKRDYYLDQRAVNNASRTVSNWIAQDRPQERRSMCRTYNFKNIYGDVEQRTVCQ